MVPRLNAKAQGPFSREGEGRMTPQQGRKGPGLTLQEKDGCRRSAQPDAVGPGKPLGWVTAGWAAGVGVRGDTLHLAARASTGSWRAQLIGNELWSRPPPACLLRAGEARSRELSCGRGPEPRKCWSRRGVSPATATVDAEEFAGLLEASKAPQGLHRTLCFSSYLTLSPPKC